jgi:hypothetical protein
MAFMANGEDSGKGLLKKIAVGIGVGGGLALLGYGTYRLYGRGRELPVVIEPWMLDWVKKLEDQGVR